MKKNEKGFTLLETLVASTLIISTLIFLYVQFNNLNRNYNDNFRFDSVQEIHEAKQLAKYFKANAEDMCDGYNVKPCRNEINGQLSSIYNYLNIKESFVMSDTESQELDFQDIKDYCTYTCQRFMRKSKRNTDNPRLIVVFKNNNYASIIIK